MVHFEPWKGYPGEARRGTAGLASLPASLSAGASRSFAGRPGYSCGGHTRRPDLLPPPVHQNLPEDILAYMNELWESLKIN